MSSPDPTTEAFLRYLRQEVEILSGPIEAGREHVTACGERSARELIRNTLRSVADYFVRMSGAMTSPTDAFWSSVVQSFEQNAADGQTAAVATHESSSSGVEGNIDLTMLNAIAAFDRENGSTYLPRAKMFVWRFAEAFVAADMEGTIDEESALEQFRTALDERAADAADGDTA